MRMVFCFMVGRAAILRCGSELGLTWSANWRKVTPSQVALVSQLRRTVMNRAELERHPLAGCRFQSARGLRRYTRQPGLFRTERGRWGRGPGLRSRMAPAAPSTRYRIEGAIAG